MYAALIWVVGLVVAWKVGRVKWQSRLRVLICLVGMYYGFDLIVLIVSQLTQAPMPSLHSGPCQIRPHDRRWLTPVIFAVNDGIDGGFSNRVFEMISFIGIAKSLRRHPHLSFIGFRNRRKVLFDVFPNIKKVFDYGDCAIPDSPMYRPHINYTNVFEFFDLRQELRRLDPLYDLEENVVIEELSLLQNYRYFHAIRSEVMTLLQFKPGVYAAAERLVNPNIIDANSTKICVHTRRGDFLYAYYHQHSTANFTLHATREVIRRESAFRSSDVHLFVFGSDREWARGVFEQIPRSELPNKPTYVKTEGPAYEEWALATTHCDVYLLTAPLSTFGWWMAYLTPNATVYYSDRFTKKIEDNDVRDALMLPSWYAIPFHDDPYGDVPLFYRMPFLPGIADRFRTFLKRFNVFLRF